MIYERGLVGAGGHGHVAIVERATKTTIIVYEQNWGNMFVEKHSRARAQELGYFRYKGLKGDEMLTSQMQNDLIRFLLGRIPNATEKKRIGKHTYAKERKIITDSSEFRNEIKGVKLAGNHLPVEMR
jgi:surface antigen